jgi:hypothetical protein
LCMQHVFQNQPIFCLLIKWTELSTIHCCSIVWLECLFVSLLCFLWCDWSWLGQEQVRWFIPLCDPVHSNHSNKPTGSWKKSIGVVESALIAGNLDYSSILRKFVALAITSAQCQYPH